MKLNPIKLAIAGAIVWAVYIVFIGWTAAIGWGNHNLVDAINGLYVGYHATFVGGLIGGLWGLVDGFIGGLLVAWLYNTLNQKSK